MADQILKGKNGEDIDEDAPVKVKSSRTVINKFTVEDDDPSKMSRGILCS